MTLTGPPPLESQPGRVAPLLLRDEAVQGLAVLDRRAVQGRDYVAQGDSGSFRDGFLLDVDDRDSFASLGRPRRNAELREERVGFPRDPPDEIGVGGVLPLYEQLRLCRFLPVDFT